MVDEWSMYARKNANIERQRLEYISRLDDEVGLFYVIEGRSPPIDVGVLLELAIVLSRPYDPMLEYVWLTCDGVYRYRRWGIKGRAFVQSWNLENVP